MKLGFLHAPSLASAFLLLQACSEPAPYPEESPPVGEDDGMRENSANELAEEDEVDAPQLAGQNNGEDIIPDRDGTLTQDEIREPEVVELDVAVTMTDED